MKKIRKIVKIIQSLIGKLTWYKETSLSARVTGRIARLLITSSGASRLYINTILKPQCLKMETPCKTKVILSFDCDLKEDVEAFLKIVSIMKQYGIVGSFACIGRYVEEYPDHHIALAEAGHEIMNHTHTHPNHKILNPNKYFNQLSDKEILNEIRMAHEIIDSTLGVKCIGFRSPHFGSLHTKRVYGILRKLGYKYSSSTIATRTPSLGLPFEVGSVMEIPLTPSLKQAFTCPETWAIMRAPKKRYNTTNEYITELESILALGINRIPVLNFYFDPCDMVVIDGLAERVFNLLLTYKSKIDIMTYREFVHAYSTCLHHS